MAYTFIYDPRRWVRSDSTDVTIVLPIAAGGTGNTTGTAAFVATPALLSLVGTNSKNEIAATFEATGGDTAGTVRGVGVVFKDQSNATLTAGIAGVRTKSNLDFNGALAFFANNSGASPATTFAQMTEWMRIDSGGNVGIGTTTPSKTLDVSGTFRVSGISTLGAPVTLKGYTVATLPAGVVGHRAYVTDALGPAYGVAVVGGGAVVVPVFFNGVNWITA